MSEQTRVYQHECATEGCYNHFTSTHNRSKYCVDCREQRRASHNKAWRDERKEDRPCQESGCIESFYGPPSRRFCNGHAWGRGRRGPGREKQVKVPQIGTPTFRPLKFGSMPVEKMLTVMDQWSKRKMDFVL